MKFSLFGYTVAPKEDVKKRLQVRSERDKLRKKVEELKRDNKTLREENRHVDVTVADPIPDASDEEGAQKRESYVSQVAKSHDMWMRDKLTQMSSRIRNQLANTDNTDKTDMILKGADYLCWELIRWGDKMKREQQSNQQ